MVIPSLIGAPLLWAGLSPVLVYNVLVWIGLTLSGFAMCVVVRRWTASGTAGIVAGCLYAFNAHLLTRYPHLQALHIEFLPVVLYAFDRLLRGTDNRAALLLGGAFVVQALCSNYTLVLMVAALAASLVVRPEPWSRRSYGLWRKLALTGAAVTLLLSPFLLPYYRVHTEQGLVRSIEEVRLYSARLLDYLVTPGNVHYRAWSYRYFEGRTALFPGVTATALAVGCIATGWTWRDRRARMALAFGVLGFMLSFGAALPGYAFLHEHVPLLHGVRNAARWGFLALVAIAILAGLAVAQLETAWKTRSWWRATSLALVALVTLEALRAPLPMVRFEGLADVHRRLASEDVHAVLVLPLFAGGEFHRNALYLLDQTWHWRPMINGYSGWAPASFDRQAAILQTFPSDESVGLLRSLNVTHVVLHRRLLARGQMNLDLTALRRDPRFEYVVEDEGVIVYRIRE